MATNSNNAQSASNSFSLPKIRLDPQTGIVDAARVAIATQTALNALAQTQSSLFMSGPVVIATGDYTAGTNSYQFVSYEGPGGHTINLPPANAKGNGTAIVVSVGHNGRNLLSVRPANSTSETIEGFTVIVLGQGQSAMFVSNGISKWTMVRGGNAIYRNRDANGGTTRWYVAGVNGGVDLTATAVAPNLLYTLPFIAPSHGGIFDTLGFEVTVGAAAINGNVILYSNTGPNTMYPARKLAESGSKSCAAAAVLSQAISYRFLPGELYWLAWYCGGTPTVRTIPTTGVSDILGIPTTMGAAMIKCLTVASGFSATGPDPYPAAATNAVAAPIPALIYHCSNP